MRMLLTMVMLTAAAVLPACEFTYILTNSSGTQREVSTDAPIVLHQGETYTLSLSYWEDHRSCPLGPEGTLFLLDGARWRVQRETQPLILLDQPLWDDSSSRTKTGKLSFTAHHTGSWILEVLRICTREGYQGELIFLVSEGG